MFKNPFRKKTYKPSEHSMQVHVIDPEAKSFSATLGITDERFEVLAKAVGSSFKEIKFTKASNLSDVLARASSHCVHPNELAIVSYMLGATVEKASNPLSFIENILRP